MKDRGTNSFLHPPNELGCATRTRVFVCESLRHGSMMTLGHEVHRGNKAVPVTEVQAFAAAADHVLHTLLPTALQGVLNPSARILGVDKVGVACH